MASADSKAPFSLDSYYVSEELGFILPEPLEELPPYYQPWMDVALRIPELVHSHKLRSHINKMPLLSSEFLQKHRELRLAHLALSMMTMGYVWQEGENNTVEMLPCNLSVPFWEVSQRLGFPPVLTHADGVLANWKKKDPKGPFDMENLELLVSLPGGESVRGFFLVTLLVELAAVPALRSIPTVINGVRCGDTEIVARALEDISQSIQDMTDALKLMQVYVDPAVFYGKMRIYLSGWKDNPCMPNGLMYEGVQTEPMEYSGGSAAQSSLLHCFDELLGVSHEGNGAFPKEFCPATDLRSPKPGLSSLCHKIDGYAQLPHQCSQPLHHGPRCPGTTTPQPEPELRGGDGQQSTHSPGGEGHRWL
ncbi:indoleamine 2,3-dioxygenase 1 isoform X2 [Amphiprion ocellaris]|uniref:indoleamine 2,3-dioxygenase 1 isoform X2 n=1 Tax=Amphiprion ocellaris TaxID=80972 RepID=UPI00164A077B|nr:indoleamine 2,3-dioxygenase 1 isoform X2 [Amphiprion ocellaris]